MFADDIDAATGEAELRPPICLLCGVTLLPAYQASSIDTDWVCDNADCPAYGVVRS